MINVTTEEIQKVIESTPFPPEQGVRSYQLEAIRRCVGRQTFGMLFDPGTGKTLTTILLLRLIALSLHKSEPRSANVLVLGPIDVKENWKREIVKYARASLGETVAVISGDKKKRKATLDSTGKYIFVANYETLNTDSLGDILKKKWDVIVCDEFHKCKHRTTDRTKNLIKIKRANPNAYLYALTGTPLLNSPLDSYMLLFFLNAYTQSLTAYKMQYFYDANANIRDRLPFPNWKIRPDKINEVSDLIKSCCMRVRKDDVLDLPPLLVQDIYVELDTKQKAIYKQLAKEFVAEVDGGAIVADLAITKSLRLQQICSGIAVTTRIRQGVEVTEHVGVPSNKYKALEDQLEIILAEPCNKVIIWSYWRPTYPQIAKIVFDQAVKYVMRTGNESEKEKQEAIDLFQNDPETRVLIGNQGSGIGINLTAANYAIWFSKPWSLEAQLQSAARNYRMGSEGHKVITHINLITANTIEEDVELALKQKKDSAALLLDIKRRLS